MTSITCYFSIWSQLLSAEQITGAVGVVPDQTAKKGSDRVPPRLVPTANGWHIIQREDGCKRLDIPLSTLLLRVRPVLGKVGELREVDGAIEISFAAAVTPFSNDIVLFLDADAVYQIAAFGASFDIDFFPGA